MASPSTASQMNEMENSVAKQQKKKKQRTENGHTVEWERRTYYQYIHLFSTTLTLLHYYRCNV